MLDFPEGMADLLVVDVAILLPMFLVECTTTLLASTNVLGDLTPVITELVQRFGERFDLMFCPF